ncbi:MAG: hypothetical protein ACOZF2_02115 [Thermodesulfobacteriota bacterium]
MEEPFIIVRKTGFAILLFFAVVLSNAVSPADQPKLSQVVYITLCKACGCALTVCQAGDIMVGNVFNGSRQLLLKRIDYSTDKENAKVYIKKHRVTQAPALLFLDAKGNLLWTKAGDLDEKEIADKLSQFGG